MVVTVVVFAAVAFVPFLFHALQVESLQFPWVEYSCLWLYWNVMCAYVLTVAVMEAHLATGSHRFTSVRVTVRLLDYKTKRLSQEAGIPSLFTRHHTGRHKRNPTLELERHKDVRRYVDLGALISKFCMLTIFAFPECRTP